MEMIDADGLEKFNLRALSERLGVNNGSLYYHYRYKKDILRDVLLFALRPLNLSPDPPQGGWKDHVVERTVTLVSILVKHPNLTPLLTELRPRDFGFAVEEQTMRLMQEAGVPPKYAIAIREQIEAAIHASLTNNYGTPLFVDVPDKYPHLTTAVTSRFELAPEQRAEIAARAIVKGFDQQIFADGR